MIYLLFKRMILNIVWSDYGGARVESATIREELRCYAISQTRDKMAACTRMILVEIMKSSVSLHTFED